MRKAGPILILLIGVLALAIDFLPGSSCPTRRAPTARGGRSRRSSGSTSRAASAPSTRRCPSTARSRPPADIAIIKDIVERRVNTTGVSEPVVTTQGKDRVVVELPGVTDPEAIRQPHRPDRPARLRPARVDPGDRPTRSLDPKQYPPLFSGDQVASATVGTDQNGRPAVDFVLKDDGKNKFADYTAKNVGAYFAITLDNAVVSAPVIQNSIPGGNVQITGGGLAGFSAKDATELVTVLKFGSLPFPIQPRCRARRSAPRSARSS